MCSSCLLVALCCLRCPGVFVSKQKGDTDMGSKVPKDILVKGKWLIRQSRAQFLWLSARRCLSVPRLRARSRRSGFGSRGGGATCKASLFEFSPSVLPALAVGPGGFLGPSWWTASEQLNDGRQRLVGHALIRHASTA